MALDSTKLRGIVSSVSVFGENLCVGSWRHMTLPWWKLLGLLNASFVGMHVWDCTLVLSMLCNWCVIHLWPISTIPSTCCLFHCIVHNRRHKNLPSAELSKETTKLTDSFFTSSMEFLCKGPRACIEQHWPPQNQRYSHFVLVGSL